MDYQQIVEVILFISLFPVVSYIGAFIHELGHYIAAIALKAKTRKLTIDWKKKSFNVRFNFGRKPTKFEDIVISSAGPLIQLIFSFLLIYQFYLIPLKLISLIILPSIFLQFLPIVGKDGFYIYKRIARINQIIYKEISQVLFILSILTSVLGFIYLVRTEYGLFVQIIIIVSIVPYWFKFFKIIRINIGELFESEIGK